MKGWPLHVQLVIGGTAAGLALVVLGLVFAVVTYPWARG